MPNNITNSKTLEPAYVFDPTLDANSYDIIPLITVGDEVPLLEGEFGNFTQSVTETFAMAGIPDGLGYVEIGGLKYVFMNHELSGNRIDSTGAETSSPTVTATNSTGDKVINGARVSIWMFDANWDLLGGKNLIEDVLFEGVTYSLNTATGNYEDPSGQVLSFFGHNNFTRFCSGYLAERGFVDANGQEIPVWFAPQERSDGVGTPVQANGLATPVKGLGTLSKENILAAEQYRPLSPNSGGFTVLMASEDSSDGELYLYVGRQTPENPNGFWGDVDANGNNDNFQLYVLRVKDNLGNVFGYETMAENVQYTSEWVRVPDNIAIDLDPASLSDFVNIGPNTNTDRDPVTGLFADTNVVTAPDSAANTFNSTNFRRIEDISEDPNNLNTYYLVTTGRNDVVPVNGYSQANPLAGLDNPPQEATTQRDNPLGKLHRVSVVLDANGIPQNGVFETLLEGGLNKGVSYDNIVVDSNRNVLLQEDETADGDVIFAAENRDGSVLSYNIDANEGVVGNDTVDFLFEINSAAADTANISFFEIGGWETSGIVEVDPNALPGQSSYLFDIQASTISTSDSRLRETATYNDLIAQGLTDADALAIVRPAAQEVLGGQYERGGQLFLARPTAVNTLEVNFDLNTVVRDASGNIVTNSNVQNFDKLLSGLVYNSRAVASTATATVTLTEDVATLGVEAAFDNLIGFYEISDADGGIDTNGDGLTDLTPDQAGYARAAIESRTVGWELRAGSIQNTTVQEFGNVIVEGNKLFAPFVIANGGGVGFDGFIANELAEASEFNNAAEVVDDLVAYFAFIGANPDGVSHLQIRGNNFYGFEDLPSNLGISDNDFNDAVFQFDFNSQSIIVA